MLNVIFVNVFNSVFPDSPGPLLNFITEVHSFFLQQRSLTRPVVVHCIAGVGKTGIYITLSAAIREIQNGKPFPDLTSVSLLSYVLNFIYCHFIVLVIFILILTNLIVLLICAIDCWDGK